jgi:hypothetical protein
MNFQTLPLLLSTFFTTGEIRGTSSSFAYIFDMLLK